jgi:hypothetical protein
MSTMQPAHVYGGAVLYAYKFSGNGVLGLENNRCAGFWHSRIASGHRKSTKLSHFLEFNDFRNNAEIGYETGFVLTKSGKYYLVTNRHVILAGALNRNPANMGDWIYANRISILHNPSMCEEILQLRHSQD